ncbi:type II secretion system protein GspJ [Sulfitobacter guttiformis]|uniref:Type II secretion system protein J n=1 Tax=Sulfitobacter guttiformis TaxID=74349 RepID=A0A420DTN6_9RHOB|nr:type II secretion system protein GspJ [Sulfitobacter guttiformis]KIN71056.1 general secretion pathway protein J [Sulfitobacter guttiformis KCTC 32187]RKE97540.1 general secretion pathway protein J [Sulfitobacter guttiformis]
MTAERSRDAGLSLIEVLVSLAIFAVIGIAGLAVLNTVARTGERTEGRLERLAEIDRAFLIIRRDLAQITPSAVTLDTQSIAFQRSQGLASARVAYRLDDAVMVRQIEMPQAPPVRQQLLSGIASAQWRVMDRARQWHSIWPPAGEQTAPTPIAAEVTLSIGRTEGPVPHSVTRLIVLPAGQGR